MPEIRDLTERRPSLTVGVDSSPAYDMLITLWSLESGDDLDTYDLGTEWFESVGGAMSTELIDELAELSSSHGGLWIVLMGLIHTLPEPRDVDSVLAWLQNSDGVDLRKALLGLKCYDCDTDTLAAAAQGNQDAIGRALDAETLEQAPEWKSNLETLLAISPAELGARIAAVLSRFRDEAYAEPEKEFGQPAEWDAAARSTLITTTSPSRIIELVTNGVEYQLPSHVETLLLVPSVVIRPWSLLLEREETYVLCYPVDDAFLTSEPDAPPQLLVRTYKALGDDRRLRILHRLAAGDATLQDLADTLDVAKSTIHHHIGLLRGAGLVRVRVQGHKEQSFYGLRTQALDEAMHLMDVYLAGAKPIEEVSDVDDG